MKKILIYPGAFNPPHLGHVHALQVALKYDSSFDEVWIIPSGNREDKHISTTYEQRKVLGNLFVEYLQTKISIPVLLNTSELDNPDNKTTGEIIDEILKHIHTTHGTHAIGLIGIDGYLFLQKKSNNSEKFKNDAFLVVDRFGTQLPEDFVSSGNAEFVHDTQGVDISSTHIRNLIINGDDRYKTLMPPAISKYIETHKLYL